jgi:hypothetical protein
LMPINALSTTINYRIFLTLLMVPVATITTISMINSGIFFNDDDSMLGSSSSSSSSSINSISTSNRAYAQQSMAATSTANKITITSNSVQFLPLTNATYNQLKVIIHYQTNDVSLVNTKINGIMRVSLPNGSLVKTSSFPNGFIVNQSGTIQFATSFANKTIQNVKADIVLTDLNKITPLSNIVTTNVSYNGSQSFNPP